MTNTTVQKSNVLVIEDQEEIQLSAKFLLRKNFDVVEVYDHPEAAVIALKQKQFDVILLDMNFSRGKMNGDEGMTWLRKILSLRASSVIVLMTAYGEVELAIRAIKNGAFDFIIKPWDNQKFIHTMQEAYRFSITKKQSTAIPSAGKLIGSSIAMKDVLRMSERVAITEANVLLLGENGSGKDLMAEHIHKHSLRKEHPLIKVDVGSISESIFESELFGHVKGAFTDAKEEKIGWFEKANGGTLFLDEIGNLTHSLQSKLLSAIQNSTITKVGSSKPIKLDIRLICATNADLNNMVNSGLFRKDLMYRINTVEIHIPPLRERIGDAMDLAKHFLSIFSEKYQRPLLTFSEEAKNSILTYKWPGNVRELQHSIERAVILSENDVIYPEDLTVEQAGTQDEKTEHLMNLEELEMNTIRKALTKHGGVISHAANELGLTRASLYRRLEKYGL